MEWGTQKVLRNVTIECGLPERQELNTSFLCNPLFKKKKKTHCKNTAVPSFSYKNLIGM